jgi:hypothetical protein
MPPLFIRSQSRERKQTKKGKPMSKGYNMPVYSRRWQHNDIYQIKRTATGWRVTNISVGGDGEKTGFPSLKRCFDQDGVSHPSNITEYFEAIWNSLESKEIDDKKAQEYFDRLGKWISECEKNAPEGITKLTFIPSGNN